MLAVEKWAQGKNPAIAYLAVNHVLSARTHCQALQHIKERRVYDYQFPLPDLASWFAMYLSNTPALAYKRLVSQFPELNDQIDLLGGFRMAEKAFANDPNLTINVSSQDLQEAWGMWQGMCTKTYEEIKEQIAKKEPEMQSTFKDALIRDELKLGFYFLVYFPCIVFYEVTPSNLYRKALAGDLSAIELLLKLDPLLLHDPAIGFQIQTVRLSGKINNYELVLGAVLKSPMISYKSMKKERRSIKSNYGAQIYVLAKAFKNPLEAPQIRDLFDALSEDFDGTYQDDDITSNEGFDKTIKTKAAVWQKKFQKAEKQK